MLDTAILKEITLAFVDRVRADGVKSLEMTLKLKVKVVLEHVLGNKDYTIYDAVQDVAAFATSHK